MLKDRMIVWILEYVFGGALVVVPLTSLVLHRPAWSSSYMWTTNLFVTSLGVILISCASSMRQRILLARRIETLAGQMNKRFPSSEESTQAKRQIDENQ
jgi:hypothetical protein